MRLFLIVLFFALVTLSACGKRPSALEVPSNSGTYSRLGYPAVEPIPDQPEEVIEKEGTKSN